MAQTLNLNRVASTIPNSIHPEQNGANKPGGWAKKALIIANFIQPNKKRATQQHLRSPACFGGHTQAACEFHREQELVKSKKVIRAQGSRPIDRENVAKHSVPH